MTRVLPYFGGFDFIAGLYDNKDQSNGPSGTQFTAVSGGGTPAAPVTSHVTNENKAVFAQIGYDVTDRLTFNAGMRWSWDKVSACGGAVSLTGYVSEDECRYVAGTRSEERRVGKACARRCKSRLSTYL